MRRPSRGPLLACLRPRLRATTGASREAISPSPYGHPCRRLSCEPTKHSPCGSLLPPLRILPRAAFFLPEEEYKNSSVRRMGAKLARAYCVAHEDRGTRVGCRCVPEWGRCSPLSTVALRCRPLATLVMGTRDQTPRTRPVAQCRRTRAVHELDEGLHVRALSADRSHCFRPLAPPRDG